ncbi:MAG TPA: nitrate/sulfonate/bicarbonate ABC transporter ATP-binding protein [Actinomycetota bacterium]|nr:nitrate/sulfonate/bicarbonate ABC transporter ATP-binding protein [Actinomycetota bacterium]
MATQLDEEPARRREAAPLIAVTDVTKTFETIDGELPVLEGISFEVGDGEIVALLGKSGSGKSTLLRCIAGLIAPTTGSVSFRGKPVNGPNPGTAMVFQSFALLPWLTVQQNVEIGLEARGVPAAVRAKAALRAIDVIGLDGFESAFPKELSGGMRQRVGFARALVTEPDVLLMDEPFSALDVLTAENLRGELLELWQGRDFPIRSILIVTHNIEEAILLADRVIILGSNPGRIRERFAVDLPRPRDRRAKEFEALVDQVYGIMTGREGRAGAAPVEEEQALQSRKLTPAQVPMPHASVDGLSGLAEILHQLGDELDVSDLADELRLEVDDLLPLLDALVLLGFARVEEGTVHLTVEGVGFAGADIQESKQIFARAAIHRVPLVRVIRAGLERCADGCLPAGFFRDILRRSFSEAETSDQLDTAVNWGRYAELFEYEATAEQLCIEREPSEGQGDAA